MRVSGVRYHLNRWREEQITEGKTITYGDLVREDVRLSERDGPFEKIPHGRFINVVSDFLKNETRASREGALKAWATLKKLDIPKTYRAWVAAEAKHAKSPGKRSKVRSTRSR